MPVTITPRGQAELDRKNALAEHPRFHDRCHISLFDLGPVLDVVTEGEQHRGANPPPAPARDAKLLLRAFYYRAGIRVIVDIRHSP